MAGKQETTSKARERLLECCRANGWSVTTHGSNHKPLREPWAEKVGAHGRKMKLVFKGPSVLDGAGSVIMDDVRGASLHDVVKTGFGAAAVGLPGGPS